MRLVMHAGIMGDTENVDVYWFDHNSVNYHIHVTIRILDCDKPRTLVVEVDGETLVGLLPNQTFNIMPPAPITRYAKEVK